MKTQKYLVPFLMSLVTGCSFKQEQSQTKQKPTKLLQKAMQVLPTQSLDDIIGTVPPSTLKKLDMGYQLDDIGTYMSKVSWTRYDQQVSFTLRHWYGFFAAYPYEKLDKNLINELVNGIKHNPGDHRSLDGASTQRLLREYSEVIFRATKAKEVRIDDVYANTWQKIEKELKLSYLSGKQKGLKSRYSYLPFSYPNQREIEILSLKTQPVAYLEYYYGIWQYVSPKDNPQLANEIKAIVLKNLNETYVPALKKNNIDTEWLVGEGSISEKLFSNL